MEGRWLPWKEQTLDIRPTLDYKKLAKPLRAPPRGLEWTRLGDGSWELQTIKTRGAESSSLPEQEQEQESATTAAEEKIGQDRETERAPEFLEHVVLPDDTLVGICMKYKVKERELRRLNGFVGDHFRMCEVLVVPNRFAAGQQPIQEMGKPPMTRDEMVKAFRNYSQLGPQEARFYLGNSGWDMPMALAEWREENRWESQQPRGIADGARKFSVDADGNIHTGWKQEAPVPLLPRSRRPASVMARFRR